MEPPPRQQATHVLVLPEGLLGNESLVRKSSLSRHGAPQCARLLPYPSGQLGQPEAEGCVSLHILQFYPQSHVHLLRTENAGDVTPKDVHLNISWSIWAGTFKLVPFSFGFQYNFGQWQINRDTESRGMEKVASPLFFALAGCHLSFKSVYLTHFK